MTSLSENFREARFLRRLSYAMHAFLVVMQVILLVVCLLHLEENVVVSLTDNDSFGDLTLISRPLPSPCRPRSPRRYA